MIHSELLQPNLIQAISPIIELRQKILDFHKYIFNLGNSSVSEQDEYILVPLQTPPILYVKDPGLVDRNSVRIELILTELRSANRGTLARQKFKVSGRSWYSNLAASSEKILGTDEQLEDLKRLQPTSK